MHTHWHLTGLSVISFWGLSLSMQSGMPADMPTLSEEQTQAALASAMSASPLALAPNGAGGQYGNAHTRTQHLRLALSHTHTHTHTRKQENGKCALYSHRKDGMD